MYSIAWRSRLWLLVPIACFVLGSAPEVSRAQDFDAWIANMKTLLTMDGGPHNEGKKDNRNSVGTGSVVDWLTYPGQVYVEPQASDTKYTGTIAVHFSGRERKADYVLGAQRDTNDTQTSGRVVAKYSFGFDGTVSLTDIRKEGGLGRVGNAVIEHVQGVNGKTVKP